MHNDSEYKKQIRQKLGELPVKDGDKVWSDLEKLLDKKETRKTGAWFNRKSLYILFILLFLSAFPIYFLSFKQDAKDSRTPASSSVSYNGNPTPVYHKNPAPDLNINVVSNSTTVPPSPGKQENNQPIYEQGIPSAKNDKDQQKTEDKEQPKTGKNSETDQADTFELVNTSKDSTTAVKVKNDSSVISSPPAKIKEKTKRAPVYGFGLGFNFSGYLVDNFRSHNDFLSPNISAWVDFPYAKILSVAPFIGYFNNPSAIQVNYIDSPLVNRYNINALHLIKLGVNNRIELGHKFSVSASVLYARILKTYSLTNFNTEVYLNPKDIPGTKLVQNKIIDPFIARNDFQVNLGAEYRLRKYIISAQYTRGFADITAGTVQKYVLDNFSLTFHWWFPLRKND